MDQLRASEHLPNNTPEPEPKQATSESFAKVALSRLEDSTPSRTGTPHSSLKRRRVKKAAPLKDDRGTLDHLYKKPTKKPMNDNTTHRPRAQLTTDGSTGELLDHTGTTRHLHLLGSGTHHRVWRIEGQEDRVIKTVWRSLTPITCENHLNETYEGIDALRAHPWSNETDSASCEIRSAKVYAQLHLSGYWEVERVDAQIPKNSDWKLYIDGMLWQMGEDPEQYYIHDFHPSNIRMDSHGMLVHIDPRFESDMDEDSYLGNLEFFQAEWDEYFASAYDSSDGSPR